MHEILAEGKRLREQQQAVKEQQASLLGSSKRPGKEKKVGKGFGRGW
jgi:hypothetical protein